MIIGRSCRIRRNLAETPTLIDHLSCAGQPQAKARAFHSLTVNLVEEPPMNSIIYLVGLIVVVMAILSFIGLR